MFYAYQEISTLLHRLTHVRRAPTPYGTAPHKPILLLSLLDYLEQSALRENKFLIDECLFDMFRERWHQLVHTGNEGLIGLPLHHLQGDKLWRLKTKDQKPINPKWVEATLKKKIQFGELDRDLFRLAQDPDTRDLFRTVLLDYYFPDTKDHYLNQRPQMNYQREIELEILEEAPVRYGLQKSERYGPLRHWKFRYNILQAYGATCCISGLHVDDFEVLIDAAHIKPFRKFHDNSIRNGLALSPTLHRAFDNGLLTIDPDYQVHIGKIREEDAASGFRHLEGKKILLPKKKLYWPDPERLRWHQRKWSF